MRVLFVATHPDDETLGCGGTIFHHKEKGDDIYWLIITSHEDIKNNSVKIRNDEIRSVNKNYGFRKFFNLYFPPAKLDTMPYNLMIDKVKEVYTSIKPQTVYFPFENDVHTDHQITSKLIQSTIKWFRYPFIKKAIMYETVSETDFNFGLKNNFKPNLFINIEKYINLKIKIMHEYKSEIGEFPFPRSEKAIRALSNIRGSQSGYMNAEAFQILFSKE